MTACPSCLSGTSGFLIHSSIPLTRSILGVTVQTRTTGAEDAPVRILEEKTAWIEEGHFYGLLEFWEQYYNPAQWQFYRLERPSSLPEHLPEPLDWERILQMKPAVWIDGLIERKGIRMVRQPIVECHGTRPHTTIGFELLARGTDSSGASIPPLVLLKEASSQNRLFHLDRACRIQAIRSANSQEGQFLYFINFIPSVIYVAEHCLETTMKAIRASRLSPEQIVFEVTESEFVEDLNHLKSILRYYRNNGFRYALDDVGEGHNTLDTLRFLEPDIVKLDRKWVSGIQHSPEKQKVARDVQEIARHAGTIPLAEGVEDPEEARVLEGMGYLWQQGFLYGKPESFSGSDA